MPSSRRATGLLASFVAAAVVATLTLWPTTSSGGAFVQQQPLHLRKNALNSGSSSSGAVMSVRPEATTSTSSTAKGRASLGVSSASMLLLAVAAAALRTRSGVQRPALRRGAVVVCGALPGAQQTGFSRPAMMSSAAAVAKTPEKEHEVAPAMIPTFEDLLPTATSAPWSL
eukprot:CAMPEP_0115285630 /NCGR_PEP_ID=MMETSP0270-20121206/61529_1 /TAXON_ID=71861 /ORGANISM="Scrippsiella trochoidea, Strain CCMP3099" /LENGTH=170 /DNA_ID=CAMNT_0002702657 /DNA_START=85 /DNA_END=594 /DNA_ORIENTATION=+